MHVRRHRQEPRAPGDPPRLRLHAIIGLPRRDFEISLERARRDHAVRDRGGVGEDQADLAEILLHGADGRVVDLEGESRSGGHEPRHAVGQSVGPYARHIPGEIAFPFADADDIVGHPHEGEDVVNHRPVAWHDLHALDPRVFLEAGIHDEPLVGHLPFGLDLEGLGLDRQHQIGRLRQLPALHKRLARRQVGRIPLRSAVLRPLLDRVLVVL